MFATGVFVVVVSACRCSLLYMSGCFVERVVCVWEYVDRSRAFSSNGRAPASHAGGRGIDTPNVQSFAFCVLALPYTDVIHLYTYTLIHLYTFIAYAARQ